MKEKEASKIIGKIKKFLDRFWFLVWKDDSLKGWLLSIIFIFIVIKFIFFPSLSFITGTQLPLAIVESCSMYHDGNLLSDSEEWWQINQNKYSQFEITKEQFLDFPMKKGFNKGDILFIVGVKPENIEIGDIIIFNSGVRNTPIIHRVINITNENGEYTFSTIGDNNPSQISFEKTINENQIVGKAKLRIAPYLGWGKLVFYQVTTKNDDWFCE
ncbi:MAG: signal peptidase I [Candidatus Pacearchaeota archaeon]|nr:signal peptidase I [Candidatus Pacearchaeota archaeon]